MSRVLFLMDAPAFNPRGRMAGIQVRTYEMARALARRGHQVSIAGEGLPSDAVTGEFSFIDMGAISGGVQADVCITSTLTMAAHFAEIGELPVVADGFEFPFASFLSNSAANLPHLGDRVMDDYRNEITRILQALKRADRVLCANENQRIGYITLLSALGKINPKYNGTGSVLQVCSGTSPEQPASDIERIATLAKARSAGPVVLWAGGCYPWFDVDTYIAAMPAIASGIPNVQFLFVGVGGMEDDGTRLPEHREGRKLVEAIRESPALAKRSHFVPWLTYADRGLMYAASDVGVVTYGDHMETTFSMRTRTIDMVWGGLPVVCSSGDSVGQYLAAQGAAVTVPAGNAEALASAIVRLLDDAYLRAGMKARLRELSAGPLSWDVQVEALHKFCREPRRDPSTGDPLVQATAGSMLELGDGLGWKVRHFLRRAERRAERELAKGRGQKG